MNKNLIVKNLNAIICALAVISLILPFCSITASVSVAGVSADASESVNGLDMVRGTGFWGISMIIGIAVILLANYVSQLQQYKKYAGLLGSALMILGAFMAPRNYNISSGDESAGAEISTSYQIGFWLFILFSVILAVLAVISFLNLKGNPVFDAINAENGEQSGSGAPAIPKVDFSAVGEKIGTVARNVTSSFNKQTDPATPQTAEAAATQTPAPAPVTEPATPAANVPAQAVPAVPAAPAVSATPSREDSDYILSQINKLFEMKQNGILTEEEFVEKKAEYLKKL